MATVAPALDMELAELRLRLRLTLHDSGRPIDAKMSAFRTLLLESRRCAANAEKRANLLDDCE